MYTKAVLITLTALTTVVSALVYPRVSQQHIRSNGPSAAQKATWDRANELYAQADDAWRKEKNYAKSEALFQEALALNPRNSFLKQSYADLLVREGKVKEALPYYRETIHPTGKSGAGPETDPLALRSYADACIASGDRREANWAEQQIVLQTSRLYPDYPKVSYTELQSLPVSAMANLAVGLALQRKGHDSEALEIFTQTSKDQPNLALAHLYMAQGLERKIGFKATAAKVEYQKAYRLGDSDVQAIAQKALK